MSIKHCSKCGSDKSVSEFYKNRSQRDGLTTYCKPCWKTYQTPRVVKWMKENPEKAKSYKRNAKLKLKYGISAVDYEALLLKQGGRCVICRRPPRTRRLAVDHCHKTLKVRGLLCADCNRAIGLMNDDPELMLRSARYLYETKP